MKTIRRFLKLIAPFWFARSQWREWLLLASVVGFALALVRVSVWLTRWNKSFFDALAKFNGSVMPQLITQYLIYIALIVIFAACGNWLHKTLLFRWREFMTRQFEQHWLSGHKHYRLQITAEPDNPDQRIAEDVYLLASQSIDLFKYFIMNVAKLGAFLTLLWQLSGVQTWRIGGHSFSVHGYLVWVALVYSIICTVIGHLIGNKLRKLHAERQHREADYRATLLRVRDHSEQIALYHGETAEQGRFRQRFERIKANWRELINREFRFDSFNSTYFRISMFIPLFATLPMYLARTVTLGGMMEIRSAFGNVQDGFGWYLDYYKRIMEWAAVVDRLAGFQDALHALDGNTGTTQPIQDSHATPHVATRNLHTTSPAEQYPHSSAHLQLGHFTLHTAQGRTLLSGINLKAQASEWLLLDGHSGIGKSTLLRTLAGLWPYYQGQFQLHADSFLFLPQDPYLPQESLSAVISYPHPACNDDTALHTVLQQVGMAHFNQRLDQELEWYKVLSGGEQQRISLARALLHRPAMLFLDEATNQLDDDSALQLMRTLRQTLPHTLCIGTSHQPSIKALFDCRLDLRLFASQQENTLTIRH